MKFIDTSSRFVAGVFPLATLGVEMNGTEKIGSFELGSEIPLAELCLK